MSATSSSGGSLTAVVLIGLITAWPAAAQAGGEPASGNPSGAARPTAARPGPAQLTTVTVASYPHDRGAFTQGLLLHRGSLYESTGLRGRSSLRRVDVVSGEVHQRHNLPTALFGEGLARVENRLIQLTWTSGIALSYSLPDFAPIGEYRYRGEGWGLCFDGELLVMSDGSHRLALRDPTTFEIVRSIEVRSPAGPVSSLNELECRGRYVYANVWGSWRIVQIDKYSGNLVAEIDASNLMTAGEKESLPSGAVLNGIAFDPASDTFLLTGKLWPKMYRVRFPSIGQ